MKKLLSFMLAAVLILSACGTEEQAKENTEQGKETVKNNAEASSAKDMVTLDLVCNADDATVAVYKAISEKFTKANPHITVNVSSQGKDYESLMKSNMAANELPDMFTTHGWSVARYSEYLRPLNDQAWASNIREAMMPIISNEAGEFFVLPIDADQAGIVVNKDVLAEAGVDQYNIDTWDDFMAACEKVKNAGKTPIGMWGKDPRTFSQFLDQMANPFYVTSPSNDDTVTLQDGTFDWSKWNDISKILLDLKGNGYLNVDVMTADFETIKQELAKNNVAFIFTGNTAVKGVIEYNEEANMGFIPLPAVYSDDMKQFVGGEREAIGVWKDGEHVEEALMFLEFMAQKENIALVCEERGNAPAHKDIEVDLGVLTEDYSRFAKEGIAIYPYFDRVMLPSGMWSVLQDVGSGLIADAYTVDEASKIMEENYLRLRSK